MSDDRCDLLCLDLPRAEDIRQHLHEAAIADTAARGKALGDPTRVTIAVALREGGELCVCDLAWITGRPENLVCSPPADPARRWPGELAARAQDRLLRAHRARHTPARHLSHTDASRSMSTTPLELPIARTTQVAQQRLDPRERDRLIRRAKALSWLSLAYMTAEGAIAITAALLAGSVALLGFGLDSAIEALASVIVIWRFTGSRRLSHRRRTTRRTPRRDQLLPTRPVHRARRDPRPDRRRAPPHQLARDRPLDLQHHRHAPSSATPSTASASAWAPAPPPAKAPKTCSAPTSPPACSPASRSTPPSASGGPIPPSRSPSPPSPSKKAAKPGKAKAAAPPRPSLASRALPATRTAAPKRSAPSDQAANPRGAYLPTKAATPTNGTAPLQLAQSAGLNAPCTTTHDCWFGTPPAAAWSRARLLVCRRHGSGRGAAALAIRQADGSHIAGPRSSTHRSVVRPAVTPLIRARPELLRCSSAVETAAGRSREAPTVTSGCVSSSRGSASGRRPRSDRGGSAVRPSSSVLQGAGCARGIGD